MSDAIVRALAERNRAGDLDVIPVQEEDQRPFLQRLTDMLKQGAFGEAQPGQRGTWVPSQINAQGKPELAVPGVIQQPAESLQSLMTAPLSDIVRSGDRDAIRAASEASFDVAGALPAAGAAIGRSAPKAAEFPLRTYHGRRDPNPNFDVMRNSDEVWSSTNPTVAGDYASKYGNVQGAVVPMDTTLSNPLRVQPPRGTEYDAIPFEGGTYDIRQLSKIARERGHDGMIAQGVMDSPELPAPPGRIGDTVVTFKKGSVKSPITGETLFSNADDPTTAAAAAALTAQERPTGIKAYHGSPHDFDRFDLSKIGTGEGGTLAGYGHYFADAEPTAKYYRDRLSKDGKGRMYEVNISTDDSKMLQWDKPVGQQSPEVREALRAAVWDKDWGAFEKHRTSSFDEAEPSQLYAIAAALARGDHQKTWWQRIKSDFGRSPAEGKKEATQLLAEHGVDGVKFLDQWSRKQNKKAKGSGDQLTHNYVIFKDELIDVLKKYSNAPDPTTAAILALLTAQQGGQQQQ